MTSDDPGRAGRPAIDEHVRELERRWRASGAAPDGGAWLAARVRAGGLSPLEVELAAFLGHAAAREALGWRVPFLVPEGGPRELVEALEPWGRPALGAAALGAARIAADGLSEVAELLEALDAWLACPCAPHASAVREELAASSARGGRPTRRDDRVQAAITAAKVLDGVRPAAVAGDAVELAVEACGEEAVLDAVRLAVAPRVFGGASAHRLDDARRS